MYNYAIIGNCQVNALVSDRGSIDWFCVPRPDSEPIFSRLLDQGGGSFSIDVQDKSNFKQEYILNTNVLETVVSDDDGNSFSIIDFAPRFEQFGRRYRPCQIIRIIRPLTGAPKISVSCKVTNGWSKSPITPQRGNSHLQFPRLQDELRVTTNMPLTYLIDSVPIVLTQTLYFAVTWGLPVEDDLPTVCEAFLKKTIAYWRNWIKHCTIPSEFQKETIRSALVLKLHCYEETGAILASVTSSLPEETGKERNWDYRFCWLRDACFTVSAFYRLGHFEEMEGLLLFIRNLLHDKELEHLHPVYRLDGTLPLPEVTQENWEGYEGSRPVRLGNQAAMQIQNDVYGELLLILAPLYFDERFSYLRTTALANTLAVLAERAFSSLQVPDAGLWEHRDGWKVHSFSILLSWAGLDRYLQLLKSGRLDGDIEKVGEWELAARIAMIGAQHDGFVGNSTCDPSPDASLLLMSTLRFPDKELARNTALTIMEKLTHGASDFDQVGASERALNADPSLAGKDSAAQPGVEQSSAGQQSAFLYRYLRDDGFGRPTHPFVMCSFWLAEALAQFGDVEKGRSIVRGSLEAANHVGLFSEHYDVVLRKQMGNFPQCYSHVGLINAAFAISAPWSEIL